MPRNYRPAGLEISNFLSAMDLDLWEREAEIVVKLLLCGIVKVNPAKQIGRQLVKWQETSYTANLWHSIAPCALLCLVCISIIYTCFGSAWCWFKKKKSEVACTVYETFHNFYAIVFSWFTIYITIYQSEASYCILAFHYDLEFLIFHICNSVWVMCPVSIFCEVESLLSSYSASSNLHLLSE